jgi:pSer/pThr/pTyr-binding forkhead associated (FHA) protein
MAGGGGTARLGWTERGLLTEISLEDDAARYEIGRLPTSEICLQDDRGVSRRHAEIVSMAGRWQLTDLGSRNGTYVNGELVRATATLVNGTMITCGTTELCFEEPITNEEAQAPSTEGLIAWPPLSAGDCALLVVFTRPFIRTPESQFAGLRPPKNREISEELGYTEETIRKRLKELYRKFHLTDLPNDRRRQELALRARLHRGVLAERRGVRAVPSNGPGIGRRSRD